MKFHGACPLCAPRGSKLSSDSERFSADLRGFSIQKVLLNGQFVVSQMNPTHIQINRRVN